METGGPAAEAKPFTEVATGPHLSATSLGRTFGLPATRMNYVLSELGWIQKSLKGWKVTPQGAAVGGVQREDTRSGIPYVMAEIVHVYERKLPVEEDVYCDFYLPAGKVYIEFWGMEDDPRYAERMRAKKAVYAKYGFSLIDLNDEDVHSLDDVLPAKLLKFGVQSY